MVTNAEEDFMEQSGFPPQALTRFHRLNPDLHQISLMKRRSENLESGTPIIAHMERFTSKTDNRGALRAAVLRYAPNSLPGAL